MQPHQPHSTSQDLVPCLLPGAVELGRMIGMEGDGHSRRLYEYQDFPQGSAVIANRTAATQLES